MPASRLLENVQFGDGEMRFRGKESLHILPSELQAQARRCSQLSQAVHLWSHTERQANIFQICVPQRFAFLQRLHIATQQNTITVKRKMMNQGLHEYSCAHLGRGAA
jgi:hypothetical protein